MFNRFEERLVDEMASRTEQSRFSYSNQTEDFRQLNTNFEIYINDMKRIDEENIQLQKSIDEIRLNYISTLENHLKRLPEDFRQESQILNDAHVERYKLKCRAKRFHNEREESKKRIHFVVTNEKLQFKRLNQLEKLELKLEQDFRTLNEQLQKVYSYVQTEKQRHQQAMDKVDCLRVQLEQSSIERSKTEFEIQTLREELQLMQTAKEFLDDEHQTILLTQTEANEYLLSSLNQSIELIRNDFNELNKTHLKQIENQYKQTIANIEENTNENEFELVQPQTIEIENEYLTLKNELTQLNNHNEILTDRIHAMENDLYRMRNERIRNLLIKDHEFETSQIQLEALDEKINHLIEYDRNLKFELTLYRGVLESEYRRKQQQQLNTNQQISRPMTLRTTTTKNKKHISKNSTHRNQLNHTFSTESDRSPIKDTEQKQIQSSITTDSESPLLGSDAQQTDPPISLNEYIIASSDFTSPIITPLEELPGSAPSVHFIESSNEPVVFENQEAQEASNEPVVLEDQQESAVFPEVTQEDLVETVPEFDNQEESLADPSVSEEKEEPATITELNEDKQIEIQEERPESNESQSSSLSNITVQEQVIPSYTEEDELTDKNQIPEEILNSSEQNANEGFSSTAGYYGALSDATHYINQVFSKTSSRRTSLTDVDVDNTDILGEAGSSASQKQEDKDFDENAELTLESIMDDLRYVYQSLANEDDVIDISEDFSQNLIDRLEFNDDLIRTLFDRLLQKYIIEPTKSGIHSKTLNWIEFRDILFPILTCRYTEGHIRKLFHLFDLNKIDSLSFEQINELLELLQISNASEFAENHFSGNEQITSDDLIESIRNSDEINQNLLSDEIEFKSWYLQTPAEEELQTISIEVPSATRIHSGIILLSRIFKRVGIDIEKKQLNSKKPSLSMKLTNEFIHNNIPISNDDLHMFIDLYLNRKQNSDVFISWHEFWQVFLPIVNGGLITKDDLQQWLQIIDVEAKKCISNEQILHILRLLQVSSPEEILSQIEEIHPNKNDSWTYEEFLFGFENLEETSFHLLSTNDQITSFNLDWLTKPNI